MEGVQVHGTDISNFTSLTDRFRSCRNDGGDDAEVIRKPHVLYVDARNTGVGRKSKYRVQDTLIIMCWYVDVLELVVVILDLCEVVINAVKHRSQQLNSMQM